MTAKRLLPTAIALAIVSAPGVLSPPPARAVDRLPEDPAAGAKSTAQWREHMEAEEHERKLHWDRNHLKQHRAVVKFLVATRARYDRAKTKAAVTAIRTRLPPAIEGVRKQITRIDHWGTNSNLLGDYDVLLKALSDAYPAARIAFLDGDNAPLDAQKADFDRRIRHIEAWLAEAAESKNE